MPQSTLYEILGIARDATVEQIKTAYRERAMALEKMNKEPDALQRFRQLNQAYQILLDPDRRRQYDATLPPSMTPPPRAAGITQLWQATGKLFFERSPRYTPAIDAFRVSDPLTVDGNTLIIGIDPAHANLLAYINTTDTANLIRKILAELTGKPIDFRFITGTTVEEWVAIRDAEARRQQQKAPATPPASQPATTHRTEASDSAAWEELMENIFRHWSALENRGLPQTRARFILQELRTIIQTEDANRAAGIFEDAIQRFAARSMERLASLTGVDSTVIALEYIRLRTHGKGETL